MRGLLFLLSALFLLESTKGTGYDQLNDHEKDIVDRAIKQANKDHGKGKHLDFYTIASKRDSMLNVILRPTLCDSTTQSIHRPECKTEDKRPQVSCIACKGKMEACLLLKEKEEIKKSMEKCSNHNIGGAHLLFQKGGHEQQQTGCLGCI